MPPDASPPVAKPAAQEPWTVRRVLEWTTGHLQKHGSDTPRLDAEILLAHARGCKRIQLYTSYDEILTDAVRSQMRELVQRRAQHEPVAYLVGHREFFSLDFVVTRDVLIPRPDTETLVLEAIAFAKPQAAPRVLDLCTGSGCVAIAIAKNCPAAQLTATDLSPAALAIARQNAEKHAVTNRIAFCEGDLLAALPDAEPFDLIVSNPPYIPTAELATLQADVRQYEPQGALDGGSDGLDIIRRIFRDAAQHLNPEGALLVEFSPEQAATITRDAEAAGYGEIVLVKDTSNRPRVLRAKPQRA